MNFGIELIGDDKTVIDHRTEQVLNPNSLPPIELAKQRYVLTSKQEVIANLSVGTDEGFYINRIRGSKFDKTYYASKVELLILIHDCINEEEFAGLDLTVANEDFTWVFVTNHDGDIYKMR